MTGAGLLAGPPGRGADTAGRRAGGDRSRGRGSGPLDLYCGVGLFTAGLAARVGAGRAVLGVESEPRAVADARRNLHDLPQVRLERGRRRRAPSPAPAGRSDGRADVVVLDPPRTGAGRGRGRARCSRCGPRVVVYVACDPAALARDVATAAERGYRLDALRAFDLFPMTHHVECVATLVPAPGTTSSSEPGDVDDLS